MWPDHGVCWEWTGGKTKGGYGIFFIQSRPKKAIGAHRFAYEDTAGPIPAGLTLDHLCRHIICVRPSHMEPVTLRVNILRSSSPPALQAAQERCKRGHRLSGDNLYIRGTERQCRACRRAMQRKRRHG